MTTAVARPVVLDDWSYLPRPQRTGTQRLVCFPHAGGDVGTFAELAAAVGPDVEVLAVRLPGRGGRYTHPLPGTFAELTSAVAAGIGPRLGPDAVFYGQSFGALLAYEVAVALGHRGPAAVVAASAPAPADWERTVSDVVADPAAGAERLLAECGLTVPDDDAVRAMVLAVLRADIAVGATYRHRPVPPARFAVHALAGAADSGASPPGTWAGTTTGPFTSAVLPGGHLLVAPGDPGPADLLRTLCLGARSDHDHDS
ncbi:thioesterase II family protein [Lentzea albida]|uniref:Surfactin synthase thioesterase subunit n=1 Tax=Lentzea albida TaxID=65499 RepID=A0A1H9V9V1_9PSEU|nr:alpha/beta fold hydrolase [Lentzea albida]SES18033.1 Surfactin synthase thioesterase subunit [Lentzea albida]